jgi:N-acetyl-gamma-glutamyl-phosphate reductase
MGISVAVAGASGYAGGELLRLLAGHPDLEIAAVSAGSSAGKPITQIHPNLIGHPRFDGKNFDVTDAEAMAGAELIFMALPHGEAAALASRLPNARIVDLSADFRLGDEDAWHQFYGSVPYAGRWAYGLPELPGGRDKIKAARTVAAPGCYATTSILALAPLLNAGLVEPDDIVIVAASGTTGAGRSLRSDLLASEIMGSMSAYKVGGSHRHTPEIEQALTEVLKHQTQTDSPERTVASPSSVTLSFTPTLAPMPRGILATATAKLAPGLAGHPDVDTVLRQAFADSYGGGPFVHLLAPGQWPVTGAVAGSNGAHVQVAADRHAGRAARPCRSPT